MKIGIVQLPMGWTIEDNLAHICRTVSNHYHAVDTFLFPELSLSGFHRQIRSQADPVARERALDQLAQLAYAYRVNLCLGLPFQSGYQVFNRYLCIDRQGHIAAQWDKIGLTDSEKSYFTAGGLSFDAADPAHGSRPIMTLDGINMSTILCREAEDVDCVIHSLQHQHVEVLLWPSYIMQVNEGAQYKGFYANAATIAEALQCYVIQCNWPYALNDPAIRGMGRSVIIGPRGERLGQLPADKASVGIFDLQNGRLSLL
ncbi:carbon-nitrogen hydrolase family protein [Photobacterium aphoticum]|uniref:CN hydrolase domain-containing protein n=1 Tax=Photobacterium aphoticum TaxID=754436 RepID=A0A0J1GNI6_9GAMM|nr:carbon-nitrogen hydrolase family protein [Photobacterium aphoticum]KLV01171.1 hypothetical protein ABT58_08515 [Photobacterium aphoticum]GHA49432.1 hypothetical protein GCM10007086_24020 [Photobacterium aphoticum]